MASSWPWTIGTAIPDYDADGTSAFGEHRVCVHVRVTTPAFKLVIKTDPEADRAVMELVEVDYKTLGEDGVEAAA